jgi:hypothetical protein
MLGFRGRKFEIPITRSIESVDLAWPSAEERRSESLGGNRDYCPLGRVRWTDVRQFIDAERSVINRIAGADDWEACYVAWLEECEEDPFLAGFDLGTNALSASLSAARSLPFYGCNGGAFDDGHNDAYPLVAFFCRPEVFPFVKAASEKAKAGLEHNHSGGLNAFGRDVDSLINMAAALFDVRTQINGLRLRSHVEAPNDEGGEQGEFF